MPTKALFEKKITKDVSGTVQEILANVRNNGDVALREYTERFDKVVPESWLVPKSELDEAFEGLDHDLFHILEEAADNIMSFHERQKVDSQLDFNSDGTVLGWKVSPVDSVGIYIPGGRAVYPSTLLMNAILGTSYLVACLHTVSLWGSTPATAQNTATAPSRTLKDLSTSIVKST